MNTFTAKKAFPIYFDGIHPTIFAEGDPVEIPETHANLIPILKADGSIGEPEKPKRPSKPADPDPDIDAARAEYLVAKGVAADPAWSLAEIKSKLQEP